VWVGKSGRDDVTASGSRYSGPGDEKFQTLPGDLLKTSSQLILKHLQIM